MKHLLVILLIILLGAAAILGLYALLIELGVSDMASQAFSGAGVCLVASAFFWLGGLKWFAIDSPRNRLIAIAVCLGIAGNSLTFYILRLAGMDEKLADMLATIIWLGLVLAAIIWRELKRENKNNP